MLVHDSIFVVRIPEQSRVGHYYRYWVLIIQEDSEQAVGYSAELELVFSC